MINSKIISLFDLFLPRICLNCGEAINTDSNTICEKCFNQLEIATPERIKLEFERKFLKEKLVKDFYSAFVFKEDSAIQKMIHGLKYNKNFTIGSYLGIKTAKVLENKLKFWQADLIMAIPLHKLRKAERGFNQADIIAKAIGKEVKIKFSKNIIQRIRFTQTQTKLNLVERKENMNGAFKIRKAKLVKDKNIILVDDVITTGATVSECAKILLENGAKNIYALSVAIAE
ncbi:MAG: ComF family protein [Ignavibacteriae bacterium]|nr:ComF family protein [Ignavibacteriota bacterium]